ncbi:capsular exopolysaccharide family [Flavobacterium fryxellicola]|uniref:non-specific protein-tyrosine kinase n=1 Tax=Flavobacterium fryxellicola TaxID=249352 RepID=A0A162NYQ2_9FLAO|nr:polysaccharide biosynthesis tyrosine autokinase [Flavobacterium fryxellicola]OAB25980.1 tyrosine protein kinase [Flavobacterium fryxellicola]SHN69311.1 capsular exopolysaccharide family [Flavobacterium fryxellicola]
MENNMINENSEQDFQIRAVVDQYASYWRWFVLGVFVSLFGAYLYLRYTVPQYRAATTILVKDEKKGGLSSELSAFADMGIGGGKSNLDNEVEILKSRTLVESTVRKMNLNIAFVVEGKVINTNLYKNAPILINYLEQKPDFYSTNRSYQFLALSESTFQFEDLLGQGNVLEGNKKVFRYGEPVKTKYGTLVLNKSLVNPRPYNEDVKPINIVISPLENVAASYRARLNVAPLSKTSSIVELSLVDPVRQKAEDFLDNLVQNYNEDAAADKNFISENTSKFIANRLALITDELDGVEQNVQNFKNANQVTDIETEAGLFITGSNEYDKKGIETDIQLNVISSMVDFIKKSKPSDLLPTNIVSGEATELIGSYNQLVLDRNRILKSATDVNPTVIKLNEQLASLKSNVASSLSRMQSNLRIQKRDLNNQEGLLNQKISKIPVQERQFRVIARQQKVKEELYLYLLQKREETAISLAATESSARVVDSAKGSDVPVSPKKNIIYLGALLLGILVPFGVIYLMDLLDTKIKSRLDLEGKTLIPFIGDVPTSDSPSEIIKSESRTSSAEALRIIRTNLEFMLSKVPDGQAKTIFLTSTFPKEGKTFVSANLAATFALSGKKVLLIGMDIRNPRLDEYLTLPDRGVTNYLSSKNVPLEDLIVKYDGFEDFHVLPAGVIPPNPAELLMNKKVDTLFETLKNQYDYIIVDTAPVSLVTDTLLIAKHADCFIYVARANFLEKRMLNIANTLYKEQKLPNMCLLLNDTDSTKGYGYGYGYGVKIEKTPWYKKIFKM